MMPPEIEAHFEYFHNKERGTLIIVHKESGRSVTIDVETGEKIPDPRSN